MIKLISALMIVVGLQTVSFAQSVKEVKTTGMYQEIDVAKHNKAVEALNGKNKKLRNQTVNDVLANPDSYSPPVLYALSRELFSSDRKEEAAYWFYVAQLRARYDAYRCTDHTARQVVSVLNGEYGPEINKYAFENLDLLEKTIDKVVEFVRTNEEDYDPRWVNLHGMGAVRAGLGDGSQDNQLSEPEGKWKAIKTKTINEYYSGFKKMLASKKG